MRVKDPSGCSSLPRKRGFTLLELLVVLVIIGLVASMITLATKPGEATSHRESRRFLQVLEAARQQAVLFNQDFGMEITEEGYRVFLWQAQQWRPLEDAIFSERTLPENLQQTLWFNGVLFKRESGASEAPHPQILLFATGEVTPFEWALKDRVEGDQWQVTGDPLGAFQLEAGSVL